MNDTRKMITIPYNRRFLKVDLVHWVYGAIEKYQRGTSWSEAWIRTYHEVGGRTTSGLKGCPMAAAKTLYEHGRLKDGGKPFKECKIPELWQSSKNGTYALLATRLLCKPPV